MKENLCEYLTSYWLLYPDLFFYFSVCFYFGF